MAHQGDPVRITVQLDGMEEGIDAWSAGEQWNGFECPMFELEQVKQLQSELQDDPAGPQVNLTFTRDDIVECWIDYSSMGEEPEWVPLARLVTAEGVKEVFPIGAGSWAWWKSNDPLE